MLSHTERSALDRGADPLGQRKSVLPCRVREQARELFPSDPTEKIIGPQLRSRQSAKRDEDFIAGSVPEFVVDGLKTIEIKHN